jgi:hypothetical protein
MRGSSEGRAAEGGQCTTAMKAAICAALLALAACAQALSPVPAAAQASQPGGGECVPLQGLPLWGTRANGEPCLLGVSGGPATAPPGAPPGGDVRDDGREETIVVGETIPCETPADCLPSRLRQGFDLPLESEELRQPPSVARRPTKATPPKKRPPSAAQCRRIMTKLRAELAKRFPRDSLEYIVPYVRDVQRDPRLRSPWLDGPAKLVAPALKEWDSRGCEAVLNWRKA